MYLNIIKYDGDMRIFSKNTIAIQNLMRIEWRKKPKIIIQKFWALLKLLRGHYQNEHLPSTTNRKIIIKINT